MRRVSVTVGNITLHGIKDELGISVTCLEKNGEFIRLNSKEDTGRMKFDDRLPWEVRINRTNGINIFSMQFGKVALGLLTDSDVVRNFTAMVNKASPAILRNSSLALL